MIHLQGPKWSKYLHNFTYLNSPSASCCTAACFSHAPEQWQADLSVTNSQGFPACMAEGDSEYGVGSGLTKTFFKALGL